MNMQQPAAWSGDNINQDGKLGSFGLLRRVPQWSDGVRSVTARLIEQVTFFDMDDLTETARTLWLEHLGHPNSASDCDFFCRDFEQNVDDIKLRRWTLEQSAPGLIMQVLELTAWPGDNEHGSVWVLSDLGVWIKVGYICDQRVDMDRQVSQAVQSTQSTHDLQSFIHDFNVVRREYDFDYHYAD
jgi:hypothetical protein